jgi:DNA-binding MarR family transcriptional regulator
MPEPKHVRSIVAGRRENVPRGQNQATLLTHRILILSNTLGKGAVRLYAGRFGIALAQWRLLAALALDAPATVTELATANGIDKGWVSRTAATMIRRGWVTIRADRTDARRGELDLTPKGRALYDRIVPEAEARQRRLVSVLGIRERARFELALARLQERAAQIASETSPIKRVALRRTGRTRAERRSGSQGRSRNKR